MKKKTLEGALRKRELTLREYEWGRSRAARERKERKARETEKLGSTSLGDLIK